VYKEQHPVLVIENKTDYGKKILAQTFKSFVYEQNQDAYPVVRIRPAVSNPTITIVAYGGMAEIVAAALEDIFIQTDLKPVLIVPSLISQLPVDLVAASAATTGRLLVIEEGTPFAGIGAELVAAVAELSKSHVQMKRIAALPVPIPSVKSLENLVLPDKNSIISQIKQFFT